MMISRRHQYKHLQDSLKRNTLSSRLPSQETEEDLFIDRFSLVVKVIVFLFTS